MFLLGFYKVAEDGEKKEKMRGALGSLALGGAGAVTGGVYGHRKASRIWSKGTPGQKMDLLNSKNHSIARELSKKGPYHRKEVADYMKRSALKNLTGAGAVFGGALGLAGAGLYHKLNKD